MKYVPIDTHEREREIEGKRKRERNFLAGRNEPYQKSGHRL